MTKAELSQLAVLNKEIKMHKDELINLEYRFSGVDTEEIQEARNIIENMHKRAMLEYNKINRFISNIDDSFIRQIISLRYVNNLGWSEVASSIGGGNTEDSVRKTHDRFLMKK